MFADPISLTINAVATSFARYKVDGSSSQYVDSTGNWLVKISHTLNKRQRSVIEVSQKKIAADPLLANVNAENGQRVYLVVDRPRNGAFSATETKYAIDALTAFMNATNVGKFVGTES